MNKLHFLGADQVKGRHAIATTVQGRGWDLELVFEVRRTGMMLSPFSHWEKGRG
jgi:hypothetical protein